MSLPYFVVITIRGDDRNSAVVVRIRFGEILYGAVLVNIHSSILVS